MKRRTFFQLLLLSPLINLISVKKSFAADFNQIYSPDFVSFDVDKKWFEKREKGTQHYDFYKRISRYDFGSLYEKIFMYNGDLAIDYCKLMSHLVGKDKVYICRTLHAWIKRRINYRREVKNKNYFQNPYETLKIGTGDCEDFAILFYFSLERLNFSQKNLLLSFGNLIKIAKRKVNETKAEAEREPHVVLIVNINQKFIVMDSASSEILLLKTHKKAFEPKFGYALNKKTEFFVYIQTKQRAELEQKTKVAQKDI